jgi:hypothetical protein
MKMIGASNVVSRNESDKCSSPVGTSGLETSQSVGEDSCVGSIAVTPRLYTSIYTLMLLVGAFS